jgi:hypothetical protein
MKKLFLSLLPISLLISSPAYAFSITGALSSIESISRLKDECPVCFSIAESLVDSAIESQLEDLGIADFLNSDVADWLVEQAGDGFDNISFGDIAPQIGISLIEDNLKLPSEAVTAAEIISGLVFSQQEEETEELEKQLVNQATSAVRANIFTEAAPSTLEVLKGMIITDNETEMRMLQATQNLQQKVEEGNIIEDAQLGIEIEEKKQKDLNKKRLEILAKNKILVLPNN